MFEFNLQRFGGGTSVVNTPAQVTPMSPEQTRAVQLQNAYIEKTGPVLADLVNRGSAALAAYQAPDFSKYYQQGMDVTQDASTQAKQLAQGYMPTAYQANMNQAVSDATAPYLQKFSNLGSTGNINSSLMRSLSQDWGRGVQAAANQAYNQNLASASNLNQIYGQTAVAPLGYQNTYYQTATQPAKDFLNLGTATYQPTGQAATAAQNWQAQLSAPAQSNVIQRQDPFGQVLGSVAGAATSAWMCFAKGTKIKTPKGDVRIENIKVGDLVCTLTGVKDVEKVLKGNAPTFVIKTNKGEVICTETEVFLTTEGPLSVEDMFNGDIIIHETGGAVIESITANEVEDVYEIVVPWFYANGFVVDGFDPEGVK